MFKKSIIASSVLAALASTAAVADDHSEDKYGYDVYGVLSVQVAHRDYETAKANDGIQVNNESRIGFRGYAKFDGLPSHTKFIWQIESGYVDESFAGENGGEGYLGKRDTFVGFDSTEFGLIRAGRVLTPLYEVVDWPASNPGLGDIYDWGGIIGGNNFNDRQSDTVRWDSKELWTGFTLDIAAGAGQDRAGSTGSTEAGSNYYHGAAAHQNYKYGEGNWVQFDLAYEMNYDTQDGTTATTFWDNTTYLVGVQGGHGPVGYFAQYRMAEADNNVGVDEEQNSYSVGLMYNFGADHKWQAKVAYAGNEDLKVDGVKQQNTSDDVWSTQLMYKIDSNAVVYARYRDLDAGKTFDGRWKTDSFKEASVGVEYWF
ncbi:porin [Salinisphaera sp. G21_0]|uniref:porin n=1 Tax=Salinisphaera sp. G21_0 TaxID=2821094 RepID=UPI001ADA0C6D|nr:porin [Salinisphaera sp. G21_0]MBO9482531.1 porin [Salinisphaera sp. G21_0]